MSTYLINYYSKSSSRNLKLETTIKEISDQYIEVFLNTWFISTSEISLQINSYLATIIEEGDQLLVTETTGDCSSTGLKNNTIEFLDTYC